jgi:hypothetical protein
MLTDLKTNNEQESYEHNSDMSSILKTHKLFDSRIKRIFDEYHESIREYLPGAHESHELSNPVGNALVKSLLRLYVIRRQC